MILMKVFSRNRDPGLWIVLSLVLAGVVMASAASAVTLQEIARVDVSAEFNSSTLNGTNPSAVAWDGRDLFVAGFNNSGSAASVGIVRYDNALSGAVAGPQFGQLATPGSRGYSGLDISGALAAAYDSGAADPNGLQLFDRDGVQQWAKNIRGGSGTAFDPGFGGSDSGVAWTTFGSGRRALQNTVDGSDIYTTGDGMIITPDFAGSFWRDMDFDGSGNLVARRSNDVTKLTRTGGNSGTTGFIVDNAENAPFVNGQNIAFVYDNPFGDFVIWNDRLGGGAGQVAADVLKVNRFDGTPEPLTLNLIGGGDLPDSVGYYDFSWDDASDTLALMDFGGRTVHIFAVPEPTSGVIFVLASLLAAGLVRRK